MNTVTSWIIISDDSVKKRFIQVLKQKYGEDPFKIIIRALMEIFDFDFVTGYDDNDDEKRHVVFKPGMSQHYYTTAMNSLKFLYLNRMSLPVMLPEYSLPPEVPNEWVQKEQDLMDDMDDEIAAEEAVTAAQSAADLPLPLQDYKRLLKQGILKLQPLFEHAKTNPGAMVLYNQIKVSIENALQKVQEFFEKRSKKAVGETSQKNERRRSRSPSSGPRRSARLLERGPKRGGLRKIKTVRRHNSNKHKKTKSRRV